MIAGGGNSAGQAVLHAARYARRVLLLVRGDDLEQHMSDYLIQAIRRTENVEVRLATDIVEVHGRHHLERLTVRDRLRGVVEDVPTRLLLVLIGVLPQTEWLAKAVECDAQGFVVTGADVTRDVDRRPLRLETSMPGVFAAGDVRHGSVKRVASAVGEGAIAVQLIHEYLSANAPAEHAASASALPPRRRRRGIHPACPPRESSLTRGDPTRSASTATAGRTYERDRGSPALRHGWRLRRP